MKFSWFHSPGLLVLATFTCLVLLIPRTLKINGEAFLFYWCPHDMENIKNTLSSLPFPYRIGAQTWAKVVQMLVLPPHLHGFGKVRPSQCLRTWSIILIKGEVRSLIVVTVRRCTASK